MGDDTKERVLDAAERLFADRGYAATSLRAITRAAGANLGAVNYHFGSKEGLFSAVFARRLNPIAAARTRLLGELEERAAREVLSVEEVVKAFIVPLFGSAGPDALRHGSFLRLMGRLHAEPVESLQRMYDAVLRPSVERFIALLAAALPELSAEDLYWRLHFVHALAHETLLVSPSLPVLTQGICSVTDKDDVVERVVRFACAGLVLPPHRPAANAEALPTP